jgi:hypothetical protein
MDSSIVAIALFCFSIGYALAWVFHKDDTKTDCTTETQESLHYQIHRLELKIHSRKQYIKYLKDRLDMDNPPKKYLSYDEWVENLDDEDL